MASPLSHLENWIAAICVGVAATAADKLGGHAWFAPPLALLGTFVQLLLSRSARGEPVERSDSLMGFGGVCVCALVFLVHDAYHHPKSSAAMPAYIIAAWIGAAWMFLRQRRRPRS
jgi:hypothetical protein